MRIGTLPAGATASVIVPPLITNEAACENVVV